MADRVSLHDFIVRVLNEGLTRDQAEQALVREEIKRHGSHWAAKEIWTLRRKVATLQKRLAKEEGDS